MIVKAKFSGIKYLGKSNNWSKFRLSYLEAREDQFSSKDNVRTEWDQGHRIMAMEWAHQRQIKCAQFSHWHKGFCKILWFYKYNYSHFCLLFFSHVNFNLLKIQSNNENHILVHSLDVPNHWFWVKWRLDSQNPIKVQGWQGQMYLSHYWLPLWTYYQETKMEEEEPRTKLVLQLGCQHTSVWLHFLHCNTNSKYLVLFVECQRHYANQFHCLLSVKI